MGIIIAPYLTGALVIVVAAMINSVKLLNSEIVGITELGFGLMISLILFGVITLSYIIKGKIWGLSPFFRIPLFAIFIPFALHYVLRCIYRSNHATYIGANRATCIG